MSINLNVPEQSDTQQLKPKLTVIGVGGAGGNAVNNMINSELEGVDFIVANTDAQALVQSKTERRIQLGASITQGLGAGSRPEVGRAAAEEAIEEIIAELEPDKRGPYAGAVGYFDLSGNMDTAITIRTLVIKDGIAYGQAGGGVVYDSTPEGEYQETLHKASVLLRAIDEAESTN